MTTLDATMIDGLGYVAAGVVFLTFCMKTMTSLRVIAITSNIAFILYALAAKLNPILILHGSLLPLNVARLVQMRRQVRLASAAARTKPLGERFDWLIPHGEQRTIAANTMLFSKGDPADRMFIVIEGQILLPEIGVTLGPGSVLGEMALFLGDEGRTASAMATETTRLSEITTSRFQELYFDNPSFAYALIRLITRRLVATMKKMEQNNAPRPSDAARPVPIAGAEAPGCREESA